MKEIRNSTAIGSFVNAGTFAFLFGNIVYRFYTIYDYSGFISSLFIFLGISSLFVIFFPRCLRAAVFFFGASFFLFGFRSYDIQSQVFETIVAFVGVTVFVVNLRNEVPTRGNQHLIAFVLCYVSLSLFSLILLPVGHIVKNFWFFGLKSSLIHLSTATPDSYLYPLAGVNRLILFFILAFEFARTRNAQELFKWMFTGLFAGGVFSALIGLLDYYKVVSLKWYRFNTINTPGSLHSTFLNRGWFAEFILSVVPFVLIGFMGKIKGLCWKILLLSTLVICEITLILAGARAGWVSYPLILFICWLFFYFAKEERLESFNFKWWQLAKIAVSVPITIVISFLLIFQVLIPLSDHIRKETGSRKTFSTSVQGDDVGKKGSLIDRTPAEKIGGDTGTTRRYIKERASGLVKPGYRVPVWMQGIDVGREKPLFGLGYESFCFHANILSTVQESHYTINKSNKFSQIKDTPHNTFIQLFVSGGFVGFLMWLAVVGYTLVLLIFDLIRNKRLLNVPVIISILSFQIYGIFQTMQYIPMIWLLMFLNLGYAMTINDKILPQITRKFSSVIVKALIGFSVIGGFVYLSDTGSESLAKKYDLEIYSKDQNRDQYPGFYHREKGPNGDFRWSGKRALIMVPRSGLIELKFGCYTPGVEKEPVVLSIYGDGEALDEIIFTRKGLVTRHYIFEEGDTANHEIVLLISRTWNPKRMGLGDDNRDLGVAVIGIKFPDEVPKDGIGFYDWEAWGGRVPGWPSYKEKVFRWTGKRARTRIRDSLDRLPTRTQTDEKKWNEIQGSGIAIFLACGHPDIERDPVVVEVLGNGKVIREERFKNHDWRKIILRPEEFKGVEVLSFIVSRTWNPKTMGISQDNRELGVAVAMAPMLN